MNQSQIQNILERSKIKAKEITNATNSFNSNVYIIKSENNKKYVLKFCNNQTKMLNESKYMNYLKTYIPVSKVISTGKQNDKYYIIQSFLDGNNIYDEEANNLSTNQIQNIGILLAKLHSCKPLETTNNSWITYLNNTLDKTEKTIEKVLGKENNNKISTYLKNYIKKDISNNYKNSILHMDFRIGNIIFKQNNKVGLIDLESMKNGEYVFDFVKLNKILNKENFKTLITEYNKIKPLENNFKERLEFYTLFDSYTSLWWSITKNKLDTNFYKSNYKIVINYLEKQNKK